MLSSQGRRLMRKPLGGASSHSLHHVLIATYNRGSLYPNKPDILLAVIYCSHQTERIAVVTIEEAVLAYVAAWNENDITKRHAFVETCWADTGTITSNYVHVVGREELLENIAAWRRDCPNDRAIFTSGIEQHHTWFRFTAIVIRPDGSTYSQALDIGEVGSDGRIIRIITFHGPLPPVPSTWPPNLTWRER
jgi:hypothetical protein